MSVDLSGQRLGHYLVQEVIGRGGMSVVYRATDERLERAVALKVMSEDLSADAEFRSRFAEEARAASAIDHVNVVPLYDFGEEDGLLFIAMRLVDGTDLARELAAGPIPVRRVMNLLGQVGAALDMLHERGLVHLDVKPANVLITRNELSGTEHVYLGDFGLTRRGTTEHRTESGDFLGSPSYASPEHLRGEEILASADEYSLTCMLFTALANRPPYVGDVRTVITGHLSGQVPSLSALTGLPTAIDRVIARGLAHDPAARYPTSQDLLASARKALAQHDELEPARPRFQGGASPAPAAAGAPRSDTDQSAAGQYPGASHPGSAQLFETGQPLGSGRPPGAEYQPGPGMTSGPGQPYQSHLGPGGPAGPGRPGTGQPRSGGSGLDQPGPGQPGAGQPGRDQPGRPHSATRTGGRSKWPWLVAAAVVVVAAVITVLVLTRGTSPSGDIVPVTSQNSVPTVQLPTLSGQPSIEPSTSAPTTRSTAGSPTFQLPTGSLTGSSVLAPSGLVPSATGPAGGAQGGGQGGAPASG